MATKLNVRHHSARPVSAVKPNPVKRSPVEKACLPCKEMNSGRIAPPEPDELDDDDDEESEEDTRIDRQQNSSWRNTQMFTEAEINFLLRPHVESADRRSMLPSSGS